jgi:RNA polymerase sigma factor (sigma-70 family)
MSAGQFHRLLSHLHRAGALHGRAAPSDAQLLECFLSQRDERAFAALVRRHGPMVLSTCRRVLLDRHAAEDAFQATFLVLVRKAASIRPRAQVGPWLYGVACRTALKARAQAVRRHRVERDAGRARAGSPPERESNSDLRPLLDEELASLPEKYRAPLVLCFLQGKSRKAAAHLLGWREGTLSGRLARAKHMLGARLRRRGLVLGGGSVGIALVDGTASAHVPESLVALTAKAATLFAGPVPVPILSAPVLALTKEVLKTMFTSKLKAALGGLLLLAGIGVGTGTIAWSRGAAHSHDGERPAGRESPGDPLGKAVQPRPMNYVIEPPDVLSVDYAGTDAGEPVKLTGPRLVRPDGTIGLGQLGSVLVAGHTLAQARAALAKHLADRLDGFDESRLRVELLASNSKYFYVISEGADGGQQVHRFPATGNETVLDALGQVKGTLIGLGKKRIYLGRQSTGGSEQVLPIDGNAILQRGETATNYVLLPGDRLFIKKAEAVPAGQEHRGKSAAGPSAVILRSADPKSWPPPSAEEVVRALPKEWTDVGVQVTSELMHQEVGAVRLYPLVGQARLARACWKCTACSTLGSQVVYVQQEHLILAEEETGKTNGEGKR